MTWVSLGAIAVLAWIYKSIDNPPWVLRIAFGLQLGGAIGNLIDRFRLGHVTDFIDIGSWPIFNVADSAIVVGIGLLIFYFWFLEEKDEPVTHDDPLGEPETTSAESTFDPVE